MIPKYNAPFILFLGAAFLALGAAELVIGGKIYFFATITLTYSTSHTFFYNHGGGASLLILNN